MAARNPCPQPKVMSSRTLPRLAHWSGKVCDRPRNVALDQSAPVIARGFLPTHAAVLGNSLEISIARRRCGLDRLARHSAGARRRNDHRLWMALSHDSVDVVSIVSAIACDGGDGTIHLIEQGGRTGRDVAVPAAIGGATEETHRGYAREYELPVRSGSMCPFQVAILPAWAGATHEKPEADHYARFNNFESSPTPRGARISKPRRVVAEWARLLERSHASPLPARAGLPGQQRLPAGQRTGEQGC